MLKNILSLLLLAQISISLSAQNTPLSADEVLKKAFAKAKTEKKNVFVLFHASWCGWCRKMDTAMADSVCKPFFDKNYVIEHLTIQESDDKKNLENPGAEELYKKHANTPKSGGIPFWIVYDANGKVLGDAKMPDGNNSGCPAAAEEVEHFISVLKKSSKMDDKTSKAIFIRFRKNEPVRVQ